MKYKFPDHYIIQSIYNNDVVKILALLPGEFHVFDYQKESGIRKALWIHLRKQRYIKGIRYRSFRASKDKGYFFRTDSTQLLNAGQTTHSIAQSHRRLQDQQIRPSCL